MSAPAPDLLAGLLAWCARQDAAARAVASVAADKLRMATPAKAGKTSAWPVVASVATKKNDLGEREADAWGLTPADRAASLARLAAASGGAMEHDAPEREAMAAHYAAPEAPKPYQPGDADPLRDGLLEGFRRHHRAAR